MTEQKVCVRPGCLNVLQGKRRHESRAHYAKRRYCSPRCAHVHMNPTVNYRMRVKAAEARAAAEAERQRRHLIPAPTEEEWLRLNGGPTMCPTMYAAPIEHHLHVGMSRAGGRVRTG